MPEVLLPNGKYAVKLGMSASLVPIGQGAVVGRFGEMHHVWIRIADCRPLGYGFSVGIAALGEVSPISRHGIGNHVILGRRLRIQMLEYVTHLGGVRGAAARPRRVSPE